MATPSKPPPGTTPTPREFLRLAKAAKSDKKEPGQAVSTKGKTAAEVMEEKRRKTLRAKEAAKGEVRRGKKAKSLEDEPTSVLEMEA